MTTSQTTLARGLFVDRQYDLTKSARNQYLREGYTIVRRFFSEAEIAPLQAACQADPDIGGSVLALTDSAGNRQELACWTETSASLLGLMPRMARMVRAVTALLDEPCYHWHSKLSLKRPGSAGRWDWHQDYAFWYKDGCLRPDLITATVAIDRCTPDNGCMQIIPRSQQYGRIDHIQVGKSIAVDPERLQVVQQELPTIACELEPGDALFFHGNLLHGSGPNRSSSPRTLLHCTYNAVTNEPYNLAGSEDHRYRPIELVSDDVITSGSFTGAFHGHLFKQVKAGAKDRYGYSHGAQG